MPISVALVGDVWPHLKRPPWFFLQADFGSAKSVKRGSIVARSTSLSPKCLWRYRKAAELPGCC